MEINGKTNLFHGSSRSFLGILKAGTSKSNRDFQPTTRTAPGPGRTENPAGSLENWILYN